MKAIINAGGKGTRAWPLSTFIPKAMLPVEGKPLLEHIVNYLNKVDEITEVIFIVDDSEIGQQVVNFFDGKTKYRTKLTFRSDKLEGTGGAILQCTIDLKDDEDFILWFSDNLSDLDVSDMIKKFRNSGCIGCIATRKKKPEETGFVETDNDNRVIQFVEKPISDLRLPEALGIYIFKTKILNNIREAKKVRSEVNFSFDVMQKLPPGSLFSYDIGDKMWIDVEGPVKIMRDSAFIKKLLSSMHA